MNAIVNARLRHAHRSKDTFFAGKAQRAVRHVAQAAQHEAGSKGGGFGR
jgi:hypothetical protein